jgi:hypothetical protein
MCRSDHTAKTAGHTDLVDSAADGSAVYVTVLGQRIVIPPRPILEPGARQPAQQVPHPSESTLVDTVAPF